MNSEAVLRIRNGVSSEIKNTRIATKASNLNIKRNLDLFCRNSKVPSLNNFGSLCGRFSKEKRPNDLEKIHISLISGGKYVTMFMKTEGALYALIEVLTGINTKLQLEAVEILINLACGSQEDCVEICHKAGAYLITNMHTHNSKYQNLSAWAMGNLCCQNEEVCNIARRQGLEGALLMVLSSQETDVLQSACYALDNYMRALPYRIEVIGTSTGAILLKTFNDCDIFLAEIAWCLYIFTTVSTTCQLLISNNIITVVLNCLNVLCNKNIMDVSLTTACVRILSNCIAESTQVSLQMCSIIENFAAVCDFIRPLPYYHLRKELTQCIANIFNTLRQNAEGQEVLTVCKFDFYMQPILQYLDNPTSNDLFFMF